DLHPPPQLVRARFGDGTLDPLERALRDRPRPTYLPATHHGHGHSVPCGTGGRGARVGTGGPGARVGRADAAPGSARRQPVASDHVAVPEGGVLPGPLLGVVVDVDEAEPAVVAVRPLEVVEQGPREVSADVGARVDRGTRRGEVVVQVADA